MSNASHVPKKMNPETWPLGLAMEVIAYEEQIQWNESNIDQSREELKNVRRRKSEQNDVDDSVQEFSWKENFSYITT